MITVRLQGGLGNQMFQYAVGRHLAIKNKTSLRLDLTFLNHRLPGRKYVFRDYDLSIFNVEEKFTLLSRLSKHVHNLPYLWMHGWLKLKKRLFPESVYLEKQFFTFDKNVLTLGDKVYLHGFWQNEQYFKDIEQIIRQEFTCKKPLGKKAAELLGTIQSVNAVCVNIRRTDYVANPLNVSFFGMIGPSYYEAARKIIAEKVANPHFFVFSDDIEWCRENITFGNFPTTYVGHEYAGPKFADYLQLMSNCHHFIIPNSTFAWWAAWLAKTPDKTIIVTKEWITDHSIITDGLIPEGWIRL